MSDAASPVPDKFAHLFEKAQQQPAAYKRSVSPRLRVILYVVFVLFALLSANGIYLGAITFLGWFNATSYENLFYQLMFLVHLGLGLLLITPVVVFGTFHMLAARNRRNRRAVRVGYALFGISLAILVSGLLLMQFGDHPLVAGNKRRIIYWAHVLTPLGAVWLYWLHRLSGPRIKWGVGGKIAVVSGLLISGLMAMTLYDPRTVGVSPKDGEKYFMPSLARTSDGKFIPAHVLQNDKYCMECHKDVYDGWFHSAHHFSSFNNQAYLATIRETREVAMKQDGNVQATRFCAGCHDPVPFFTGAFDDPKFDDRSHPTAHAGITCTVCHAIEAVGPDRANLDMPASERSRTTQGNADYVITQPQHYPFVYSTNPLLMWVNRTLVKSKPAFHKAEMLKPFHKTEQFCGSCHKVHLPGELTKYKDFLRGQNHYDSFLLSGVSGHGAQSFYYPEKAKANCNSCHMPSQKSNDFGADPDPALDNALAVKDHLFPGANTALPFWNGQDSIIKRQQDFMKNSLRVDLFGIREDGNINGKLTAPLRPAIPTLEPGKSYLLETVIRTLTLGHHFTQGTVDSNEVWLEVVLRSGDRVLGSSGTVDETREVDPWSHFVNVFMLDRNGNRIDRRNAQDIFTPMYNHQIPPGAGQTVHYKFVVPQGLTAPITATVKLNYRKFDKRYVDYIARQLTDNETVKLPGEQSGDVYPNPLPISVLAEDSITLPVAGVTAEIPEQKRDIPPWQRWNDYGIGMLLKGKAELKQAEEAFAEVEKLNRPDGPVNIARALLLEGDLDGATAALQRASTMKEPARAWVVSYFSGLVDRQQGNLARAAESLRKVLSTKIPSTGFDFSRDYRVRNELGQVLIDLAQQADSTGDKALAKSRYEEAKEAFLGVLKEDLEDVTAHTNLALIYAELGDEPAAEQHRSLQLKYKVDETAEGIAKQKGRPMYPAADKAAEDLVIYDLQRTDPSQPATEPPAAKQSLHSNEDTKAR
jgi:tetratricopeptide (TPR) repeat protein